MCYMKDLHVRIKLCFSSHAQLGVSRNNLYFKTVITCPLHLPSDRLRSDQLEYSLGHQCLPEIFNVRSILNKCKLQCISLELHIKSSLLLDKRFQCDRRRTQISYRTKYRTPTFICDDIISRFTGD